VASRDSPALANGRISIVLADHQPLMRHALRCLLEAEHRFVVTGEVGDGTKLPALLARLKPQATIIDFDLYPTSGPDTAVEVRQRSPQTAVIMLSRSLSEEAVVQSFHAGVHAYVSKLAPPEALPEAIDSVMSGQPYVSLPFSLRPPDYWRKRADRTRPQSYAVLTVRERQVLHLLSQGLSSTAIGRRLEISARTVETHREHLKQKLGVKNNAGLIRYAIERQLFGLSLVRQI